MPLRRAALKPDLLPFAEPSVLIFLMESGIIVSLLAEFYFPRVTGVIEESANILLFRVRGMLGVGVSGFLSSSRCSVDVTD